jgi:hypothetical protein
VPSASVQTRRRLWKSFPIETRDAVASLAENLERVREYLGIAHSPPDD